MKTTTKWTDGAALATRGVLAGAYIGKKALLTHAVMVDGEGDALGEFALCGRQPVENLVDLYGMTPSEACAAPTCPGCAKKAAR